MGPGIAVYICIMALCITGLAQVRRKYYRRPRIPLRRYIFSRKYAFMRVQLSIFSRHPTLKITYSDRANQALSCTPHCKIFCQVAFIHDVEECKFQSVVATGTSGFATDLLQRSRNGLTLSDGLHTSRRSVQCCVESCLSFSKRS